jgi:hypothetical protein
MKRWFHLTLVCCLLLCLCLSFAQAVGLNHDLPIVGFRACFDRGRELASDAPTVSVVTSMRFDQPRAGPLRSLIHDCASTAGHLGPPGSETHAPPEPIGPGRVAGLAVKPATPKPTPSSTVRRENTGSNHQFQKFGVLQQPLANGLKVSPPLVGYIS